jgi:hypothetical protein
VDGRLLMRLTAQHLKDDLNIAIFGHREALVEAIARLKSESAKPGVAASAPPTNDVTAEKSGMMAAKAEKLRLRLKAIETQELQMKAMKAQTEVHQLTTSCLWGRGCPVPEAMRSVHSGSGHRTLTR